MGIGSDTSLPARISTPALRRAITLAKASFMLPFGYTFMLLERESSHFLLSLELTRLSAASAAALLPKAVESVTKGGITNAPDDAMSAVKSGVHGWSKNRCASPSTPPAIAFRAPSSVVTWAMAIFPRR